MESYPYYGARMGLPRTDGPKSYMGVTMPVPESFNDLSEVRKKLLFLYQRNVSDRVAVGIVQVLNDPRERSQYLALLIEDQATGRWLLLRLSTFRKIIKFLADKKFLKSRHLLPWERMKLQIKEEGGSLSFIKRFFGFER